MCPRLLLDERLEYERLSDDDDEEDELDERRRLLRPGDRERFVRLLVRSRERWVERDPVSSLSRLMRELWVERDPVSSLSRLCREADRERILPIFAEICLAEID